MDRAHSLGGKREKLLRGKLRTALAADAGSADRTFTVVFGGTSVTAGHDNAYNLSYPFQFQRMVQCAFAAAGIRLVVSPLSSVTSQPPPRVEPLLIPTSLLPLVVVFLPSADRGGAGRRGLLGRCATRGVGSTRRCRTACAWTSSTARTPTGCAAAAASPLSQHTNIIRSHTTSTFVWVYN